jgi:hypothetical protein
MTMGYEPTSVATAADRVARGAQLLDTQISRRTGMEGGREIWAREIDMERLNLYSTEDCILAQLAQTFSDSADYPYMSGLRLAGLSGDDAPVFGFDYDPNEGISYGALKSEWRTLLESAEETYGPQFWVVSMHPADGLGWRREHGEFFRPYALRILADMREADQTSGREYRVIGAWTALGKTMQVPA